MIGFKAKTLHAYLTNNMAIKSVDLYVDAFDVFHVTVVTNNKCSLRAARLLLYSCSI